MDGNGKQERVRKSAHWCRGWQEDRVALLKKLDTEVPPIERVQGPYIKGCAAALRFHKTASAPKVNRVAQEKIN